MWWLLKTICLVHVIGNILCLLKPKPKNPEANMNVSEIISYWGYKWEVYEVVSGDGYILPIYRIPRGKNEIMDSSPKTVVYLQHGLTLSASAWILNPPSSSLGFLLADANFDVWLGNSRGNNYAMKHVYLDPNCKAFWDFSFNEQIKFDIPAIIDFIVNKTGQKQIYYVGHSQGTLLAYGAFATNPQLAQKIKANLALTPVVTTRYLSGAFRTIAYVHPTVIKVGRGCVVNNKPPLTSLASLRVLKPLADPNELCGLWARAGSYHFRDTCSSSLTPGTAMVHAERCA
ncbi:tear acid lipase-like protein isoform X2 [Cricetulus griseus]|uniref:Tear acid lipase-like protein isoform X2 n=1 Tax=Cricetulus griseus TaxID=10029 RepID=A0A9J7FL04_CRIGR|nr:tear acid lipase-like protein isoform X2 [Cricetulus griseus]